MIWIYFSCLSKQNILKFKTNTDDFGETDKKDEAIVTYDNLTITDNELNTIFKENLKNKKGVNIFCCFDCKNK
jgi:hypothetical protein